MAQHKKRSYEVSIWTLQDEFITVLKPSNVENKGQIEKAKPLIKDDGTREFSFSIPMYLYEGKEKIINPIWYNTQNGNIIEDMRKIKLTFNKDTDVIKTFEFLIIKVTESHEKDQLYCDIECEGLAFHELGKTGYKISLSSDDFYDEDYKWFTKEVDSTGTIIVPNEPHSTLQYWMNKFMDYKPSSGYIDNSKWYYKIEMNWDAYSNTATGVRDSNKIYEDEYVSSWNETETGYTPNQVEVAKEKERLVDLEESNIYNITQELAETFGVFVKYEYEHDENLHIVGRTIIFYNNYMKEDEGYIDLTYPYSTSAITRSRDGKDVTTKMYVRPADDESSASGLVTIMNVEANKSREDYLLNFDYLYSIGGITAEQYAEVPIYEKNVGACNRKLEAIEGPLLSLQGRVPELEAAVTLHTNAIQLDKERIDNSNDLLNQLTNGEGTITIDSSSPRTAILLQSTKTDGNNSYYINVTEHGVLTETVKIYRYYNFTSKNFNYPDNYSIIKLRGKSSEIETGTPENDEFGNLIKISSLYKGNNDSSVVYLTFSYVPKLYYDRVKQTWEERLAKDEAELQKSQDELNSVKNKILAYQTEYNNWLRQKKEYISAFEKMMGPAIRESYWQPDDYHDYGDNYVDGDNCVDAFTFSGNPNTTIPGSSELTELLWDKKPFDDEQLGSYDVTVSQIVTYYPVIDLSGHEEYVKNNLNKLSFMFYDYRNPGLEKTPRNIRNFPVGSLSQYGFAAIDNTVKPVLIITGVESCTQESRIRMTDNTYEPTVGVLTTTIEGSNITTTIAAGSWQPTFLNTGINGVFTAINLVYPRIRIASLALKTSSDMLAITYNNVALKDYEDYYILTRDDTTIEYGDLQYSSSYYITFKPEAMLAQGGIDKAVMIQFNISNADISIYLDAIKVLKENAFPKVSYTIDPSVVDENFSYTLYNQLNRICNINDNDLKFENIQGYISELELDCDNPENDKIEIKNYKTKFEDLFSSIVAQTEAMKKSAYTINLASQAFTSTGTIDADVFKNTVMKVDLNYAFNNGKLIIDEKNGIWGISDSGVVAFRGGGIFTATEKDSNGNWKWNTGIVPQGINADLISSGQLDTNRIKIYAGDRIAFQLNGDGLFAYKSFFSDQTILAAAATHQVISDKINENKQASLDPAQYVVHNQNGLFLVAKTGAYVLNEDKSDFIELDRDVTRVEVSWDGFKLRNWKNKEVFWADPDSGNLYLKGNVFANAFKIIPSDGTSEDDGILLDEYLDAHFDDHVKVSETAKEIFDEAGEIIQDSLKSISAIEAKILKNATILQGFYDDIKAGLKDDRIIKLYGSSSVDVYSGDITDISTISVLSLSKDKGVWIGSGKAINLFSGKMPVDGDIATNSSVCIDPTKIMFGVSSTGDATVVEMTEDYVILAAANQLSAVENAIESTWTADNATVSGVKIIKDGIWLATGTGPARSLISLTPGNITIGVSPDSGNTGPFIKLTKTQLIIGASTQLYINASNIALDSTNNGTGVGFRLGSASDPKLVFNNGNLTVSGTIYATGLYVGRESAPIDQYIDGRIPEGTHNYYQNSTPSSGYKKGETWFNTSDNVIYMAERDYVTGATPSNDWKKISVKITGTYLSVDATSGTISISATSTLSIASGNSLNISCAGNIHLYGTGNIYIDSGSNIWVYANSNVSVYGGGNLDFYGGNAISMYTSNSYGGYNTNVSIDNNGILLNGKSLELRTTDGATAVILNNNSITMNTAGNVTLQGTSGFIQFGTNMNAPAFSVDTEGVVMCRKIICSGIITGILPSSGSGTTTDPYVLYFSESDTQQAYGYYSHSRTTAYRCQTTVTPGDYTCTIDWKLICSGTTTLRNAKIYVYYRPYSSSTSQVLVYQNSLGNWAYGDAKFVYGGTGNVIKISNSTQILNLYTTIEYDNDASGLCGTRYDKIYNHLVRLTPKT